MANVKTPLNAKTIADDLTKTAQQVIDTVSKTTEAVANPNNNNYQQTLGTNQDKKQKETNSKSAEDSAQAKSASPNISSDPASLTKTLADDVVKLAQKATETVLQTAQAVANTNNKNNQQTLSANQDANQDKQQKANVSKLSEDSTKTKSASAGASAAGAKAGPGAAASPSPKPGKKAKKDNENKQSEKSNKNDASTDLNKQVEKLVDAVARMVGSVAKGSKQAGEAIFKQARTPSGNNSQSMEMGQDKKDGKKEQTKDQMIDKGLDAAENSKNPKLVVLAKIGKKVIGERRKQQAEEAQSKQDFKDANTQQPLHNSGKTPGQTQPKSNDMNAAASKNPQVSHSVHSQKTGLKPQASTRPRHQQTQNTNSPGMKMGR